MGWSLSNFGRVCEVCVVVVLFFGFSFPGCLTELLSYPGRWDEAFVFGRRPRPSFGSDGATYRRSWNRWCSRTVGVNSLA